MHRHIYWAGPLAGALIAAMLFFGITWNASSKVPIGFYEPSPFVRLEAANSVGSGVHIGQGLVVTAAHVVGQNKAMKVFADDRRVMDGEVLWSSTKYDIALMRVAKPQMRAAPLSCADNFTGQHVKAYGNPMGLDFVYTSGEVVGKAREQGHWAKVVPVDAALIYGQSGGGIIDEAGSVVGITVGLMGTPYGIAAFGFAVPSSVVCGLMGRA